MASNAPGVKPLPPMPGGDGHSEQQAHSVLNGQGQAQGQPQIAPLPPWVNRPPDAAVSSTQTAPAEVPRKTLPRLDRLDSGSIFAIPGGPMPEDIPDFPIPAPDDFPPSRPAQAPAQAPGGLGPSIQPLPRQTAGAPPVPAGPSIPQTPSMPAMPGMPGMPGRGGQTGPMPGQQSYSFGQSGQPVQSGPMGQQRNGAYAGRINFGVLTGVEQLQTGYLDPFDVWFPEPRTIAETGINQGLIADLVIKAMYYTSYMSGQDIASVLRLPFYGVLDHVINLMKKEQLCEVSGTAGLGEAGYQYILTIKGMERAHQVLARSSYVGACPVPLTRYIELMKMQTANKPVIYKEAVESALRGMIISEDLTNCVGAAVNAGKSLFLFGAPGNGKTMLAERISMMLGGNIAIPYALEADGQIVQLFDLNSHRPVVPQGASELDPTRAELGDRRWVRIHRPVVMAGGELTLASLDLVYNENAGFYEAPFQLKANGGLFLIDDFGRQQMSPHALLNRWIVPLEKGIDFLTLKTGKKLQVPFELFLVLSTNLNPEELIDDAFLRRIQNKLSVPEPTPQQFLDIFVGQCRSQNVPFDQNGFNYLVTRHYIEMKRPFRASHPRDLLRQLVGIAKYRNIPPEMTPQLLDAACSTYFVTTKPKK